MSVGSRGLSISNLLSHLSAILHTLQYVDKSKRLVKPFRRIAPSKEQAKQLRNLLMKKNKEDSRVEG